jgi:hypothetical protein
MKIRLNKSLAKHVKSPRDDISNLTKKIVIKIKKLLRESKEIAKETSSENSKEDELKEFKNEINSLKYEKLRITTLNLLIDCFSKQTSDLASIKNILYDIELSK